MKGILDKQAIDMFKRDVNTVIDDVVTAENNGTNRQFLITRKSELEVIADLYESKTEKLLQELARDVSIIRGKLMVAEQMRKYINKEIGACEMQLQELEVDQVKNGIENKQ